MRQNQGCVIPAGEPSAGGMDAGTSGINSWLYLCNFKTAVMVKF